MKCDGCIAYDCDGKYCDLGITEETFPNEKTADGCRYTDLDIKIMESRGITLHHLLCSSIVNMCREDGFSIMVCTHTKTGKKKLIPAFEEAIEYFTDMSYLIAEEATRRVEDLMCEHCKHRKTEECGTCRRNKMAKDNFEGDGSTVPTVGEATVR